jgi:hypothetical protein
VGPVSRQPDFHKYDGRKEPNALFLSPWFFATCIVL